MLKRAALVLFLLLPPSMALAHAVQPRHGGTVVDAGGYHLEMVTDGKTVTLFVMDGKMAPVDVTGATATAKLLAGGQTEDIALAPAGADRLRGTATVAPAPGAKLVAVLRLPGAKPVSPLGSN